MLISHDTRCALSATVDLLNTSLGDGSPDGMTTVEQLRAFVESHNLSGVQVGALGEQDVADMRATRELFARLFAAESDREAAELINAMVAEAGTTPQLTDHDGHDWHVHYFAPGASIADHLSADCGMALAFFLVAGERERLRRCDAPDCRRAFVDLSRNRSRRYCDSRTCGNRLHVAAYRARQRRSAAHTG
ncbi:MULTISPECIES: CGNR zinc finger domain-containing protein [Streptomyces]|uniref:CGNR zinc finger domain-containing protein n=3 Tax=Streptomyces TaxID=1883 RepID=A0A1I6QW99_9ACTN|nr:MULTISPECIES: CGNR zinc finger domain-containing protein [Streptomyces]MCK1813092.1 CGNR zinc finger domain-containing protein [Streptomyces sp. XM4011]QKV67793.1 CGNR zinc finger domain-containing protein [Streptomyces harbinensis]SFS56713.1 CGNR zinc finger domain-containing protein [Streptomyces harbinensis]HEU5040624.1 CGNR zinc finger domain-containing protein [Gemmatimonadales bacterium]